jgi:hypothetical protein
MVGGVETSCHTRLPSFNYAAGSNVQPGVTTHSLCFNASAAALLTVRVCALLSLQISTSYEQGLYSPWTFTGAIVVDGVLASTHTAWPGEAPLVQLLPTSGAASVAHQLAIAHQLIQTPLRALYRVLGAWPLQLIDNVVYSLVSGAKPGAMLPVVMTASVASQL